MRSARDAERAVAADEIEAAVTGARPGPMLPPPVSIARFLIEGWVARRRGGRYVRTNS